MVALKMCWQLARILSVACALCWCGIASAADVVLLDFSSTTCAPCQEMRPVIARLAAGGYRVRHVDIVRESAMAAQFKVDRVPTFIALIDGRENARMVGPGSYEELQQMLAPRGGMPRDETQRGQSPDIVQISANEQFASVGAGGGPMSTYAGLDTPQAGRIVELEDPNQAPLRNPPTAGNPFGNSQRPPSAAAVPASALHSRLIEATVKITVEDANGSSAGTGTIVDARDGAALLLTCGHLFRESAGKGPITVTFFQATPSGAQVRETAGGQVLDYDLERDLALVVVRPNSPVQAQPIAPVQTPLSPGAAVTTVGCNGGANPTAVDSQITTIDRYQGPPNVEVAGAPVEGRSGGGLFNRAGQLIGVCFAADPQSNEGLYASLTSIQAKLDSLNLAMVYQSPSSGIQTAQAIENPAHSPAPIANMSEPAMAIRGQDAVEPSMPTEIAGIGSPVTAQALSSSEQAALAEIQQRGLQSEVICIIRPHDPSGKSEVITLNNVSPQFVGALSQPIPNSANPAMRSPATAAAGQLLR